MLPQTRAQHRVAPDRQAHDASMPIDGASWRGTDCDKSDDALLAPIFVASLGDCKLHWHAHETVRALMYRLESGECRPYSSTRCASGAVPRGWLAFDRVGAAVAQLKTSGREERDCPAVPDVAIPHAGCVQISNCLLQGGAAPTHCSLRCMRVPIPAWRVSACRVQECLRCMRHHVDPQMHAYWQLELTANRSLPSTRMGARHGVPPRDSVLLGHNTDLYLANYAKLYDEDGVRAAPGGSQRARYISLQGTLDEPASRWLDALPPPAPGECDVLFQMGDEQRPRRRDRLLLSRTRAYFVNNPGQIHPRLHGYPRGVRQTQVWTRLFEQRADACERQLSLDRPRLLLCDCLSTSTNPSRREKLDALAANGFACASSGGRGANAPDCADFAGTLLEHKFVFSPHGNGHNNHRDFEALLAGAVPLVDDDPNLSEMWGALPVVRVQNWSAVTPAYLEALWQNITAGARGRTHARGDAEWSRMYAPYWLSRLLGAAGIDRS